MKTKSEKAFEKLCLWMIEYESLVDEIMKEPFSIKRDKKVARLMNQHSIQIQSALHFHFDYSFDKIEKLYNP